MIKFFRHIRQNLLVKGKTGKYLKYALGEIILVVLGILIALQIDNWNENNKLETRTQDYYHQLLEDLKKDQDFALMIIKMFEERRQAYDNYKKEFYSASLKPRDVYDHLFKLNTHSEQLIFNSNTMEALKNSGDIVLIAPEIRNNLIDLKNFQNLISSNSLANDLQKNNIGREVFGLIGTPDLEDRVAKQEELKSLLAIEENLREIILGMENMHAWKNFSENRSIMLLKEMLEDIEIIERQINEKIQS